MRVGGYRGKGCDVAYVTIIHAKGPKVRARVQFVVESEDGKETLAIGEGELDCQMVSLMPPTEYAVTASNP